MQIYYDQHIVKLSGELEVYCRLEGLDPLYILNAAKKDSAQKKTIKKERVLRRLFAKHMEHVKVSRLPSLR